MAYLPDVLEALATQFAQSLEDANVSNVKVGSEWPNEDDRFAIPKGGPDVVAIIHRFTDYKDQRPFEHYEIEEPKSIKSELSTDSINSGESITLTVQLEDDIDSVNVDNLISFVLSNADGNIATTYRTVEDDTLESIAEALAVKISTDIPGMVAYAEDAVITITSSNPAGFYVTSNTGNTSIVGTAVQWAVRNMQFAIWTGNLERKYILQKRVEAFFSKLVRKQSFYLPTGENVEIILTTAKPDDSDTDKDLYTDMYIFNASHFTDDEDKKYTVVAPIPQFDS